MERRWIAHQDALLLKPNRYLEAKTHDAWPAHRAGQYETASQPATRTCSADARRKKIRGEAVWIHMIPCTATAAGPGAHRRLRELDWAGRHSCARLSHVAASHMACSVPWSRCSTVGGKSPVGANELPEGSGGGGGFVVTGPLLGASQDASRVTPASPRPAGLAGCRGIRTGWLCFRVWSGVRALEREHPSDQACDPGVLRLHSAAGG